MATVKKAAPAKQAAAPAQAAATKKPAAKKAAAPSAPAVSAARPSANVSTTKAAAATKPAASGATKKAAAAVAPAAKSSQSASAAKAVPLADVDKKTVTPKSVAKPTQPAVVAKKDVKKVEKKPASGPEFAPVKGVTKDGIAYTKDFDVKFLTAQKAQLIEERASLIGQAVRLEDEAHNLIEDGEMGDVQFDDEGGEGDTMVVERSRDLALSAQARQMVADIDAALIRMTIGTYGYSIESGRLIPRERLEAIPWSTVLVEEKVGGIGRK